MPLFTLSLSGFGVSGSAQRCDVTAEDLPSLQSAIASELSVAADAFVAYYVDKDFGELIRCVHFVF